MSEDEFRGPVAFWSHIIIFVALLMGAIDVFFRIVTWALS